MSHALLLATHDAAWTLALMRATWARATTAV